MAKEGAIRRLLLFGPEIGEAPRPGFGGLPGGFSYGRLTTLGVLFTVNEIVTMIKRLAGEYERWAREGDISAHRACPAEGCDCRFRHRHGWAPRSLVCGGWEVQIGLLRLLCPKCGATEALSPEWLRRRSPYPWPWQAAAALHYVGGPAGYRPVAALFGVDYTLLWGWVRRLAAVAVDLVGVVVREVLQQEPGAHLDLVPVVHGAVLDKARTAAKRQGLAHLPLLVRGAEALRAACLRRAELPEDGISAGALGWLSWYLPLHDVAPALWIQSHRGSHSLSTPAPP